MKKLRNLICGVGLTTSAIIPVISFSSCSNETKYFLTWNASDGDFEYDKNIQLKEVKDSHGEAKFVDWEEATNMYFEDISKNPKIFVNDLIYRYVKTMEFAGTSTEISMPIPFKVDSITATYYGCDIDEHRITYSVDVSLSSVDEAEEATGQYHFKSTNELFSLLWEKDYTIQGEHAAYGLFPMQTTDQIHYQTWEIADPLYPSDDAWNKMYSTYDGWEIELSEEYNMPHQLISKCCYTFDWTRESHRTDHCITGWDDPEDFSRIKYFYRQLYTCQLHYFSKINGGEQP